MLLVVALALTAGACRADAPRQPADAPSAAPSAAQRAAQPEPPPRGPAQPSVVAGCVRVDASGRVRVSVDSIGGLPTRATFAELRARCPAALDTVIGGYEYAGPGLAIPGPADLTILAGQSVAMVEDSTDGFRAGVAQADSATDYWVLTGDAVELPGGVQGTARWAELMRSYGPALLITEVSDLWVRFCRLPHFQFVIGAYDHAGARDNFTVVDSTYAVIPRDAPVTQITVAPRAPAPNPGPAECSKPSGR